MAKSNPRKGKSQNTTNVPRIAVAIMAAGKGTRLKSKHPKVLHEIGGKPMLAYVIATATRVVPPEHIYAIIGHEAERVRQAVGSTGINFVLQEPQQGTGHALMVARKALAGYDHVIVLSGDVPMIWSRTIEMLRDFHLQKKAAMTILTADVADPGGYGRVLHKPGKDEVLAIVEEKALKGEQRNLREINSGIYGFSTRALFKHIHKLGTDNAHREYYLTDMAAVLAKTKERVVAFPASDPHEVLGSNNRWELARLDAELRLGKCRQLTYEGVTILRPDTCLIDAEVEVGPDTVIEPFVQLLGRTRIGSDCRIRSYSVVEDTEIADGVQVRPGCMIEGSRIETGAIIGPYAHLRPGSEIGEGAHIGNF
ncbi:MAG TPA: NTP transferase domain-containing protein, partial [Terriglobales bacterium]|nr:NTP transferase domain-containing protein [Terriglobales bacterium]